jgi:hypothetical protein
MPTKMMSQMRARLRTEQKRGLKRSDAQRESSWTMPSMIAWRAIAGSSSM